MYKQIVANCSFAFALLLGGISPGVAQSDYVKDGSIGSKPPAEAPVPAGQFATVPMSQWVGKKFIFLPKRKGEQTVYFNVFDSLNAEFGTQPYSRLAGQIVTVTGITEKYAEKDVALKLGDGTTVYGQALGSDDLQVADLAYLDDLDTARKLYKGKTLWLLTDKIETYDESKESTTDPLVDGISEIKVEKLTPVTVQDVVAGWYDSQPIRFIVQTKDGVSGYVDACVSGTNIKAYQLELYPFERYFATDDPAKAHPDWKPAIWDAIKQSKVMVGMTVQQLVMSWWKPQKKETTVMDAVSEEQWIYPGGLHVYVRDGKVVGMQDQ